MTGAAGRKETVACCRVRLPGRAWVASYRRDTMNETTQKIKEHALRELQEGARGAQTVATRFNMEHRKDAVVDGDEEAKIDNEDVAEVLDGMVSDGMLVQLDDPEGWYQLADWDERPLRVLRVSHHITKIDGVSQLDEVWLDESIRAARYEHGLDDPELQPMSSGDDRRLYLISTKHYTVLEKYRQTLKRLAEDTRESNPEKATVYDRLAEATDIEDQFDTREREVGLRA